MTLEIPSSPEDISDHEIIEVRKDSALYLEEAEGIPKLREILRSTLPKIIGSRRESSGCVSNLCTFDEDSRDPSSIDVLQDLSTFLDGRRSSSTPKLNSWDNIGTAEENLTEESANSAVDRMPTTELYRKISSAGLEMPNIEEVKEVLRDETSTRRGSLDTLCNIAKCISTEDLSTQCLLGEATTNREDSSKDDAREICDIIDAPKSSITMKLQDLSEDVFNTTSLCDSINCVTTQMASSPTFGKSLNRMIHRCSVPSSTEPDTQNDTMEIIEDPWRMERQLKMKIERDVSPILAQAPTRLGQVQITEGPIEINTEDDSLKAKANVDSNELLPRSIKVYQLLSVQSEDRVDGVPYLSDRRISLQISKQDDAALPMMPSVKPIDISNLHEPAIVSDDSSEPRDLIMCSNEDQAYTEIADSSTARSLPSPDEERTTPKFLGDTPNVTVRPIYPYCLYSPYGSPQGSPRNRRRPLRESRRVSIDNSQGALQLNQYKLLDNIGQGSYGIVKLAYNEEDDTHYAMKILSKKKLMKKAGIFGRMAPGKKGAANPLAKVYREIALLKKLDHPNVVKLVEVLDDPDEDNLYLVFELVQRGEVLQIPTDKPLAEETVRKNFRDVVLGVEYLHYQRIVHRDIKPSNLLVDSDGRIKIADLGVSAELRASGELLSGPAGTPAFAAPETTTPGAHYSGTLCDVWSMGVTLYSLVTGRVPWDGAGSIIAVQAAVRTEPLKFPDRPPLSEDLRDLIFKMLAKDPAERISLSEIKEHAWLTKRGTEPLPNEADNCRLPVTVTDEEVERVVTRIPKLDTLILIKTMLKQHSFQNPFLSKRSGKVTSNDTGVDSLEVAASGRHDETLTTRDTIRNLKSERFQRAGRSNSAPDSYDWQKNGSFRQVSVESPLPPVTEVSSQEVEVEKR